TLSPLRSNRSLLPAHNLAAHGHSERHNCKDQASKPESAEIVCGLPRLAEGYIQRPAGGTLQHYGMGDCATPGREAEHTKQTRRSIPRDFRRIMWKLSGQFLLDVLPNPANQEMVLTHDDAYDR